MERLTVRVQAKIQSFLLMPGYCTNISFASKSEHIAIVLISRMTIFTFIRDQKAAWFSKRHAKKCEFYKLVVRKVLRFLPKSMVRFLISAVYNNAMKLLVISVPHAGKVDLYF